MKFPQTFVVILLFTLTAFSQSTSSGKVIAISDGDTFKIIDIANEQFTIRMAGIDAPESGQPFGRKAKETLSAAIFNRDVRLSFSKIDKYGRIVAKVLVDGYDVNLSQILNGFAWHYKEYAKEQTVADRAAYAKAENEAKALRLGLWLDPQPVEPWSWRKGAKATAPPAPTTVKTFKTSVPSTPTGRIKGNIKSKIFHLPGCRDYKKILPENTIYFQTKQQAINAGYRETMNCKGF